MSRKTGAQTKVIKEECTKAAAVMNKWLKRHVAWDSGDNSLVFKKGKNRQNLNFGCRAKIILYGFTSTSANPLKPQCVFCREASPFMVAPEHQNLLVKDLVK